MIITIKTAVTFRLPREKALMEEFERNNSDWEVDNDLATMWHYTPTTNSATFRRTQIFEIGADWKGGDTDANRE